MEYTDQEIEMLARFFSESSGVSWDALSGIRRKGLTVSVCDALAERWWGCESVAIRAAARLMREAREQGAAEMRERVIATLRALPDGTWGDERGECSPWPDAIDAVKALKVPQ